MKNSDILDVVVLGAGPTGLSASLYLARAGLKCLAFSSGPIGGTLAEIPTIENYPGFAGSGQELAGMMKKQAEQAGARIEYGSCSEIRRVHGANAGASAGTGAEGDSVAKGADSTDSLVINGTRTGDSVATGVGATNDEDFFALNIDGEEFYTRYVIIATGAEPKKLSFQLEKPVSYCALCDGEFAKGKNVAVIGGANSAVGEALYLSELAKQVTIITHSALKADEVLQRRARGTANIEIIENVEPTPEILNQFDQIFVYIGKRPATGFLTGLIAQGGIAKEELVDQQGCVITGGVAKAISDRETATGMASGYEMAAKVTSSHETAISGIYAAGDVRSGAIRQVATATGDGVAAAIEIIEKTAREVDFESQEKLK